MLSAEGELLAIGDRRVDDITRDELVSIVAHMAEQILYLSAVLQRESVESKELN